MFPLVPVPSTRYPSASALLVDESFQLFIKILRGHVQGMFVYTPPSWHPVLCSATPSGQGEEEGQRQLLGSFIHSPSLAAQPRCFPQEFTLVLLAGQEETLRHSPRHSPRHSLCCCHLFVPTSCRPSHSQIHMELEQGQLHALGIQTQGASPGTLPGFQETPSAHEGIPSSLQPGSLGTLLGVEGCDGHCMEELWHQEFHPCSLRSGSWRMAQCNPHHSQRSAGVNLAEQAEVKSKPMPTGCEVCKESKPHLWDSRALQPNEEMASKCPPLAHRFPNREFILIQAVPWGPAGHSPGRAASPGLHTPLGLFSLERG